VVAFSSVALRVPIRGWSTWMIGVDVTAQRRAEVERAQATAALEVWSQRLVTLNQMDDLLLACSSLEEAYETAQPFLARLLSASSGAYFRFDASRDLAEAVVSWGDLPAAQRTLVARDCWGVRLARPHGFGAEAGELRCAHVDAGFDGRSICVPALSAGELQGILHLRYDRGEESASDLEGLRQLTTSIAGHLAIRFSAIGLRDAYRRQSTRDPLTDLFNRRYMEETLIRELRRCERAKQPLAVLAIDLDHFKSINDTHGHEAGDAVLIEVARVLRRHSRLSDVACRAGGEEFVVLLPGMAREGAIVRAEDIRRAIAGLRSARREAAFERLSASIGIAVHPEHGDDAAEVLRTADQALYRAKHEGRDRVEVAVRNSEPT
jgi:diguanylate cyclase (GGDEF)-like protein